MSQRTCEASTTRCTRPTASPSASLCQHHLDVLMASGRVRSIAEAEGKLSTPRGRRAMVAGLPNVAPGYR